MDTVNKSKLPPRMLPDELLHPVPSHGARNIGEADEGGVAGVVASRVECVARDHRADEPRNNLRGGEHIIAAGFTAFHCENDRVFCAGPEPRTLTSIIFRILVCGERHQDERTLVQAVIEKSDAKALRPALRTGTPFPRGVADPGIPRRANSSADRRS